MEETQCTIFNNKTSNNALTEVIIKEKEIQIEK